MFRDHDEDAICAAGEVETVEDEAGFDGFAEADLVCEENAGVEAAGDFRDDGELVGDEIDTSAGEAAGRGAADFCVPAECFEALVEVAWAVDEAGEEAFIWTDKGEGVEEVGLVDGEVFPVVGEEVVFLGDGLDSEGFFGMV